MPEIFIAVKRDSRGKSGHGKTTVFLKRFDRRLKPGLSLPHSAAFQEH
jgi:hypothetical protein